VTGGDAKEPGWGDFSPAVVEHYLGTVWGSAGRTVMDTVTAAGKVARGERVQWHKIPFWRKFAASPEAGYVKQKFYENVEEIEGLKSRQEARKARGQELILSPFGTWATRARRARAKAKALREKAQVAATPAEREALEDEALQYMKEFNRAVLEERGGKR
jgi:hypothetical protein